MFTEWIWSFEERRTPKDLYPQEILESIKKEAIILRSFEPPCRGQKFVDLDGKIREAHQDFSKHYPRLIVEKAVKRRIIFEQDPKGEYFVYVDGSMRVYSCVDDSIKGLKYTRREEIFEC